MPLGALLVFSENGQLHDRCRAAHAYGDFSSRLFMSTSFFQRAARRYGMAMADLSKANRIASAPQPALLCHAMLLAEQLTYSWPFRKKHPNLKGVQKMRLDLQRNIHPGCRWSKQWGNRDVTREGHGGMRTP